MNYLLFAFSRGLVHESDSQGGEEVERQLVGFFLFFFFLKRATGVRLLHNFTVHSGVMEKSLLHECRELGYYCIFTPQFF